jgi:16S rRNA (guanine966-N2)-methyltransferase
MKLRIISGELRRRFLQVPDSLDFRPTLERVRQPLADSLMPRTRGARVVDLCAGSGAFGFEMLSRGAAFVSFVEANRSLARLIDQHARSFGMTQRCEVFCGEVSRFINALPQPFDIVFYDPPYDDPTIAATVRQIVSIMAPGAIFLFQRDSAIAGAADLLSPQDYTVVTRSWGRTLVDYISAGGQSPLP